MHIPTQTQEIPLRFHDNALVAALKKMSCPVVASVEVDGICGGQPMHPAAEIGAARLSNQMIMVTHQDVAMEDDVVALERFQQQLHKLCAVGLISKDLLPSIAPPSQMIKSSFKFNP